jgi:DNA-binding HxlR family transcriptional regulator
MTDYVQKPDFRVLDIIGRLCVKFEKLYCYPNQKTLCELVFKFTGRSISVRSLCRHLGALERDGWIVRQRRHETNTSGELELHSTLYYLTKRAVQWMRSVSSNVWNWSTAAAKSLLHIALPTMAKHLAQEHHSHTHRAARAPPRT